jgi:hypothetical protein
MLSCAALRCAKLCCAALRHAVLRHAVLCCSVLCSVTVTCVAYRVSWLPLIALRARPDATRASKASSLKPTCRASCAAQTGRAIVVQEQRNKLNTAEHKCHT